MAVEADLRCALSETIPRIQNMDAKKQIQPLITLSSITINYSINRNYYNMYHVYITNRLHSQGGIMI